MKKIPFRKPCGLALRIFTCNLFLTTLFAVSLLVACLAEAESADPPNYQQYMDGLEYIFAGILLSLLGLIAVDAIVTDMKR